MSIRQLVPLHTVLPQLCELVRDSISISVWAPHCSVPFCRADGSSIFKAEGMQSSWNTMETVALHPWNFPWSFTSCGRWRLRNGCHCRQAELLHKIHTSITGSVDKVVQLLQQWWCGIARDTFMCHGRLWERFEAFSIYMLPLFLISYGIGIKQDLCLLSLHLLFLIPTWSHNPSCHPNCALWEWLRGLKSEDNTPGTEQIE